MTGGLKCRIVTPFEPNPSDTWNERSQTGNGGSGWPTCTFQTLPPIFVHHFWRWFAVFIRARFAWVLMGVMALESTFPHRAMQSSNSDETWSLS